MGLDTRIRPAKSRKKKGGGEVSLSEIKVFISSLENLKVLISEIATEESSLVFTNKVSTKMIDLYECYPTTFDDFDRKVLALLDLARSVDRDISDQLHDIVNTSSVAEVVVQIGVVVNIEKNKIKYNDIKDDDVGYFKKIISYIENDRKNLTSIRVNDSYTRINDILVSLSRLISLGNAVLNKIKIQQEQDSEIFKPSNVDVAKVLISLDSAIEDIDSNINMGQNIKQEIINHIKNTKFELSKKEPKWKKIIGSLVIVATIISGIAAVPIALDNIQSAINEILGPSTLKNIQYENNLAIRC